ncbi:MAG: helix-turn-helix transcriptional regulator [Prevotellaceae bacterium]|jgi:phage repressor protein C with HTH and peptisase S24 domain|nr:helix-turn-helix transcriptional regulator [Prevotellaceae bacterium]
MTENKRLKEVQKKLNFSSQVEFSAALGIKQGSLSDIYREKPGVGVSDSIKRILDKEYSINIEWLETGKGEMLKDKSYSEEIILLPLIPISAQAGSLNDFVVSVKYSDCEKIISPIKGADFALTVSGDSMAPEYPSGSQVLVKKINEKAFIDWGKVYVLDTCNGSVIKILVPSDREGYVKCISINPNEKYAPFEVAFKDIYSIYRVMLCMSMK